jgi:hypothetical protein
MPKERLRLYLERIREAVGPIAHYARGRQRPDLDHDMLRQAIDQKSSG